MAFLLSSVVFIWWLGVGFAATSLLLPRRSSLRNLLLGPAIGAAITTLGIFIFNRLGWSVAALGPFLTAGLSVATVLVLCWRRPRFGWRRYSPFAIVFILALFLTGWPLVRFGFDWLSYGNSDMGAYCLGASRVLHHGFFDAPTASDLVDGLDLPQAYWFQHAVGGIRCGAEMLVAWVVSCTGLTVAGAFMPVTVALHLMLVSAAGGLAGSCRRPRWAMWWTCALAAASPLLTYGVISQLVAQVAGMGVLCATAALLLHRVRWKPQGRFLGNAVLLGLLGAALLVLYPEITPLLGLAFPLHLLLLLRRGKRAPLASLAQAGLAGLIAAASLGSYSIDAVRFLSYQAQATSEGFRSVALFPYYFMPSGFANLWGLVPLAMPVSEPRMALSIVAGGILLIVVVPIAAWLAFRRVPVAVLCVVAAVLSAGLLVGRSGFGLFKLAMFAQPFLLGVLVVACACLRGRARWRLAAALVLLPLVLLHLRTQRTYVRTGCGEGNYSQIRNASRHRFLSTFRDRIAATHGQSFLIDSSNSTLVNLMAEALRGRTACFRSQPLVQPRLEGYMLLCHDPARLDILRYLEARATERIEQAEFDLHDPETPGATNHFAVTRLGCPNHGAGECEYLVTGDRQTVFNARRMPDLEAPPFQVERLDHVHDHLVFITSARGMPFYEPAAYYHLEPNPVHGGCMQSVGRHLLFEVLNPTPGMRLVLDLTATLNADGCNQVPPAAAVGAARVPLGAKGRGSCRLFSPPLTPQRIAGRHFVALDMGAPGGGFGKSLDPRKFVAFARDISAVSAADYASLRPPTVLAVFPRDLRHPDLEYSGIYEEGWVAEEAFCVLAYPGGRGSLVIQGEVPKFGPTPPPRQLIVCVDGVEMLRRTVAAGPFEFRCPLDGAAGRRRVEVRFSEAGALPHPDNRPVAARLIRLGFEEGTSHPGDLGERAARR
jgi:hypothetical protein